MAVRWTLPRFRFDQLMKLAWEGMIPTALLTVLATSFWIYFGWQSWMFGASIATVAIIWILHPFIPRQAEPNRRVKLIGSRFSPLEEADAITDPSD
jgi:NADH-quinone oxidoreductase subunit H